MSPKRCPITARRKRVGDNALHLRAFTLVELLVVTGIIALTAGVLGLALRDGSPAAALQSAQGTLASMVSAARCQAALGQNRAVLAVEADPAGDGFLRTVHVAVETAAGSNQWNLVSAATLPTGVCLVPGTGGITGAACTPAGGTAWPPRRLSAFAAPAALSVASGGSGVITYLVSTVGFTGTGKLSGTGGDRFVLAPARRLAGDALVFDNPELVRGIVLSAYGTVILVNDGPGFDN